MNNIYFVLVMIFIIVYIFYSIRKSTLSIEESFLWVVGSFVALILAIFPKSIDYLAKIVGINYPPSLFFVICILFLMLINFRNSKKIASQQQKIIELNQNIALLKEEKESKK